MGVFDEYAEVYDILYQDKDYEAECDFLETLFRRYSEGGVRSVLDMGCGTGGHCLPLSRRGYRVVGVDRSRGMLARGKTKGRGGEGGPDFVCGDLRDVRLKESFDAVVLLFNVAGYLKEDEDVHRMLDTVKIHMEPRGILVFDFWFGPSVLADRPHARSKQVVSGDLRVQRFAEPRLRAEANRIEIDYRVLCSRDATPAAEIRETHEVRFFMPGQIEDFLGRHRLEPVHLCRWMNLDQPPAEPEWNACVVARSV